MGLPVLRLPHVVFDNLYQFLDVSEIIVFSQCSRRMEAIVKSQESPRTGRQVLIDFYRDFTAVDVVRRISDSTIHRLFTFYIYAVRNRELTDEKSFFHLNVDGTTWKVKKCPPSTIEEWYCVSEEGCYEKDVLTIVKMLRNVFNCSILDIKYSPTNANFQKLFVETDALHRADKIFIAGGVYDPKDMDFMFDHFITGLLDFRGYCGPVYSYQKPLNFPNICLTLATWVTLEKVFEMIKISKDVQLYGAILIGDGDINKFIKWWSASDNKTLEFLTIARGQYSCLPQPPGVEVRINRSVIMEGIESTPGKKKREEATKYLSQIEWENGVDIIRKDGVRATIGLGQGEFYDQFVFAVWHHPNPNVDD